MTRKLYYFLFSFRFVKFNTKKTSKQEPYFFFITTHGSFDIADLSSVQDAFHNELSKYDLARHHSLSSSVVRAIVQCTERQGYDSPLGLRFLFCPTLLKY